MLEALAAAEDAQALAASQQALQEAAAQTRQQDRTTLWLSACARWKRDWRTRASAARAWRKASTRPCCNAMNRFGASGAARRSLWPKVALARGAASP